MVPDNPSERFDPFAGLETAQDRADRLKAELEVALRERDEWDAIAEQHLDFVRNLEAEVAELKRRLEEKDALDPILHAIYDAWKDLHLEAQVKDDKHFAGLARAILSGQLRAHRYGPYLAQTEKKPS